MLARGLRRTVRTRRHRPRTLSGARPVGDTADRRCYRAARVEAPPAERLRLGLRQTPQEDASRPEVVTQTFYFFISPLNRLRRNRHATAPCCRTPTCIMGIGGA